MSKYYVHYGTVSFDEFPPRGGWKLKAECGIIIVENGQPKTGEITINLAEVTCPLCQEINAFRALQEFT